MLELVKLPFDDSVIEKKNIDTGYVSRGVPYQLQLNRLQEVFGNTHIKIEHQVVEEYAPPVEEGKVQMFYYRVYVTISIGNYTLYVDGDVPKCDFISYYQEKGIGYAGHFKKGTAEKNALSNGIKDALRNIGMLRYLYINDSDEDNASSDYGYLETSIKF